MIRDYTIIEKLRNSGNSYALTLGTEKDKDLISVYVINHKGDSLTMSGSFDRVCAALTAFLD